MGSCPRSCAVSAQMCELKRLLLPLGTLWHDTNPGPPLSLLPGATFGSSFHHSVSSHLSAFSDCSLLLQLPQHSIFILTEVLSYVRYRMFKTLSHFNTQIKCPPGVNEQTETWGEGRKCWLRKGRGIQSLDLAGLSTTIRNLLTEESLSFSNNRESACMPTRFLKYWLFFFFFFEQSGDLSTGV